MKRTTLVFFLFIGYLLTVNAQNEYIGIDDKMKKIPQSSTKTTANIAEYINSNFSTESEKLRAVHYWVATNIRYDVENMYVVSYYKNKQEVIDKVLKTRKGICVHYAMLFTDIAKQVELQSYVVDGYTKQNGKIDKIPHSWCVAKIDSTWYLFDPTWASGYLLNKKFVRKVNDIYYKVKPKVSIKSHMPFDPMWQLLDYPITYQDFYDDKINDKKRKQFFNYSDSILVYEQESEIEKLASSSRRIANNGTKNAFVSNKLEQNNKEIENYKENIRINKFNEVIDAYNAGVDALTTFSQYRNKQLIPKKSDDEIKMLLNKVEASFNKSQESINEIENPNAKMLSSIKELKKSLNEGLKGVKEQRVNLGK